eukprot:6325058-Prymnesium_polylepis.1
MGGGVCATGGVPHDRSSVRGAGDRTPGTASTAVRGETRHRMRDGGVDAMRSPADHPVCQVLQPCRREREQRESDESNERVGVVATSAGATPARERARVGCGSGSLCVTVCVAALLAWELGGCCCCEACARPRGVASMIHAQHFSDQQRAERSPVAVPSDRAEPSVLLRGPPSVHCPASAQNLSRSEPWAWPTATQICRLIYLDRVASAVTHGPWDQ